jgi:hypothetical protein
LVAVGHQHTKAVAVGASELGQHEAVKDIALATGHAIARAHRLDLVGVHREDQQTRVEQTLDQQTIGSLQRHQRDLETDQPRAQRPDPRLVVTEPTALNDSALLVDHADRVLLAGPVNASEPRLAHRPHSFIRPGLPGSARGTLADAY